MLCRATQQQQQQKQKQQQLPLQWPADLELREAELLEAASDEAYSGPILSGAGGGLFFWWELGTSPFPICRAQTVTLANPSFFLSCGYMSSSGQHEGCLRSTRVFCNASVAFRKVTPHDNPDVWVLSVIAVHVSGCMPHVPA